MNTYVFNMGGPVGTLEFYEDDLKSIIWEKDEDGCWVSYDSIPCVSEPEDPEVYVYDFRVCGDDLFVGGAYVKSIYSTDGRWKRIEDWKKLLDVPEDMEESFRRRGRMLRESSTAMAVEYVIGRELFDGKWWPIIVYLNESPNRYWYEAICADEGGVYHTELGKGYLSRIRPGTDKCAPEVVEAVEDEFFGQFSVDDIPTRRVDSIEDLERHAPAGKQLISRD